MAFTANTAFEVRVSNNRRDELANITGRFQDSGTDIDCSAGTLCVRAGRLPNAGFDNPLGTRVYNDNAYIMEAATSSATANDVIYAANTYEVQLIPDGRGNAYAVGRQTLGLGIPAGKDGTFTHIKFDGEHIYRFGAGNVTINTSGDTYFTIDDGALSSVTTKPSTAGDIYFELVKTGNFVEGTGVSFGYYDVQAFTVVA